LLSFQTPERAALAEGGTKLQAATCCAPTLEDEINTIERDNIKEKSMNKSRKNELFIFIRVNISLLLLELN